MTCLHNHDQILEFLWKIFLKGFQIYQNYLCALTCILWLVAVFWCFSLHELFQLHWFTVESLVFHFLNCQICVLRCSRTSKYVIFRDMYKTYDRAIINHKNMTTEARVNTGNRFHTDFRRMQSFILLGFCFVFMICLLYFPYFDFFFFCIKNLVFCEILFCVNLCFSRILWFFSVFHIVENWGL